MNIKLPQIAKDGEYVWNYYTDGVTQSMLSLFLTCKEQCRLTYMEGWSSKQFNYNLHFGNCVHYVLAEAYNEVTPFPRGVIKCKVKEYEELWEKERKQEPTVEEIKSTELIYTIAEAVLFQYFDHYKDDWKFNWDFTEKNFKVKFPQANTYLRGKMDGCFVNEDNIYLIDHKCLSVIDEDFLIDTLDHDIQIKFYLTAFKNITGKYPKYFWYNILRRPQPRKKLSLEELGEKIQEDIISDKAHYFKRIKIPVSAIEIDRWEECWLKPNLLEMKKWYDAKGEGYTYNPNALGGKYGKCEMFDIIVFGNFAKYYKRKHNFPELCSSI